MKPRINTLHLLLLFVFITFGCEIKKEEASHSPLVEDVVLWDDWRPLFNGKNLEGWHLATRDSSYQGRLEDIFAIEDGLIHVYPDQKNGSTQTFAGIITDADFQDYVLRFEYKWGDKKFKPREEFVRDAGVIFHMHGPEDIWPKGVECQIQEGDTGDLWAIGTRVSSKVNSVIRNYDPQGQLETLGDPEQKFHRFHRAYCWEVPTWNLIEIKVKGDHATFEINGKLVNEAIDMKYWSEEKAAWEPLKEGKILLQAEGAEIFYRNIYIKEL